MSLQQLRLIRHLHHSYSCFILFADAGRETYAGKGWLFQGLFVCFSSQVFGSLDVPSASNKSFDSSVSTAAMRLKGNNPGERSVWALVPETAMLQSSFLRAPGTA